MDIKLQEQVLENLMVRNAINKKDLKQVMERLKQSGDESFEDVLLGIGIEKRIYLTVLSGILQCEWIDLSSITLEPEFIRLIPKGMAERYKIISIGKRNNQLVIAMSDPTDVFAIEYVTMQTGFEVVVKLALTRDIMNTIAQSYPALLDKGQESGLEKGSHEKDSGSGVIGRGAKDCVEERSFHTASQGRFLKWNSGKETSGYGKKRDPRVIDVSLPSFPSLQQPIQDTVLPAPPCSLHSCLKPGEKQQESTKEEIDVSTSVFRIDSKEELAMTINREKIMLTFLCQLGQDLSATLDMESVLLKVVDAAKHITSAEGASILLYDNSLNILYFKSVKGEHGEEIRKAVLPLDEQSIAGWVALHRMPLRIEDVSKDARHCKTIDLFTGFKTMSILAVPMIFRERLLGVMEVVNKMGDSEFSKEDEGVLLCLASQAGVALANAEIVEDLEEYFIHSVELLVSAVDALQPVLKGHITEVARLSAKIATELGIAGEEYVNIAYAALLHDVGKLQLSSTSLEQLEMDHPIVGARILNETRRLRGVAPYVRYHHERYDGSGHPDGISGEDIPLGARILGLVDHYSEWKMRQEGDVSADRFITLFGKHHDPKIVEAFKQIIKQKVTDPV